MPRSTFATSALDGAGQGMSRLAASLMGGQQAYQQGFDNEGLVQSRMAQALAQIGAANATARLHDAQAGESARKTALLNDRPALAEEQVALSAGTDVPMVRAIRQLTQTGRAPQVPMGPETEDGQLGTGSMPIDPAVRSKVAQALSRVVPLLTNSGDMNPEQMAKAAGAYREQDLADAIINGTADRNKVGGAQAAVGGKPLYHVDGSGAVLDQYGGSVDTNNPLVQSTIGLKGAQAGQARAAAADHYAGAGEKNARTAQVKQQTEQGAKGVLVQTDAGPVFADPRTGQARPITGPDSAPLSAPSKPLRDAVVKQLTEVRDNAATIGNLARTFRPDFGDKGILGMGGNTSMSTKGTFGFDGDAVEWWKNYRKQAELVERHALFGAALTPGEQASWQSADIEPGMSAKTIKRNLETRAALATKMFRNAQQDLIDAGNDPVRINKIAERISAPPGIPAAAGASGAPDLAALAAAELARRQQGAR